MSSDKFLPYAKQSIDESDIQEVAASLRQELITRGTQVAEFEKAFAERVGAKWAVAFTSASTGLYAAFQAADVSSFDRFLTTPNSFIATVAAGMRLGARPHFVDIERTSGNMSLERLKEALNRPISRGRYVIAPVHFSGIALDMQSVDRALKTPDAIVIEDAAHALGSKYPSGEVVGSCPYCQMTVFSFHAIKTITSAEGGAVTTNDEALYKRLLRLRNSGIERGADPWYYEVAEISCNYHMNEIQAVLGLSQLKRLDHFIQKRAKIVSWYREHLKDLANIKLFDPAFDARTTYHLMVIQVDLAKIGKTRTQLMQQLKEKKIGTQYHYIPLYRHPALIDLYGDQTTLCPEMEAYYQEALSLPLFVDLEEKDILHIASSLKELLKSE